MRWRFPPSVPKPARRVSVGSAAAFVLAALAWGAGAADGDPLGPPSVCPAIDESYRRCSANLGGSRCDEFVAAAASLASLYRSESERHPEREASLRETIWWGCGEARLADIKQLLVRVEAELDSDQARAALGSEPYVSLVEPRPRPAAGVTACIEVEDPGERQACAERGLAAAEAEHRNRLRRCREAVSPVLRDQLLSAEAQWRLNRDLECGPEEAARDASARFRRTQCLERATRERTKAILAAHPECQPGGAPPLPARSLRP